MSESKRRGRFIVLEGVDGSGITTQAAKLAHWLEQFYGKKVLSTKEPSDGPIGLILRQALNKRLQGFNSETLALLFAADRIDHINHTILPALENGNDVICDRYLWSSLAYQGRSLNQEWIREINSKAIYPDLTIFIRVEPYVTLERIQQNRFQVDLFEQETILKDVLARFDQLIMEASEKGESVFVIDGTKKVDIITSEITQWIKANFN